MNVLNVEAVERELNRCASYARHPAANSWVNTVARNFILSGLSAKDRDANFIIYRGPSANHIEMPTGDKLPIWAKQVMLEGKPVHWFDTVQVRRRNLWQAIEQIVHWFNGWPLDDKRWPRVSRINFETAAAAAAVWFSNVQTNLWDYVKDKPPVVYRFLNNSGYHWIKMVTSLHFERESRLMSHCVSNGQYFGLHKAGQCAYYSLRDKNNLPHATMEVSLTGNTTVLPGSSTGGKVHQCKGKGNSKPDLRYQPYIFSFITAQGWPITGDSAHIDRTHLIPGE